MNLGCARQSCWSHRHQNTRHRATVRRAQVDISGQFIKITDNSTGLTTVGTGTLDFNLSTTTGTLGTGATLDFSTMLGQGDVFTLIGGSGNFNSTIGTLNIPAGSTPQSDTVQLSGPIGVGTAYQITLNGRTVQYTTTGAEPDEDTIAINLAAQINAGDFRLGERHRARCA